MTGLRDRLVGWWRRRRRCSNQICRHRQGDHALVVGDVVGVTPGGELDVVWTEVRRECRVLGCGCTC